MPNNLRRILSAESAANDGLAYPFLSLALYLSLEGTTITAFKHWILIGWLCKFVSTTVSSVVFINILYFRPSLPWSRPGVFAGCVCDPLVLLYIYLISKATYFRSLSSFPIARVSLTANLMSPSIWHSLYSSPD